ncbi:hypothetical protein D3C87_94990 [compost metagenome]
MEKEEKAEQVLAVLKQINPHTDFKTETREDGSLSSLRWIDENQDECYIYPTDIAIREDQIAWFQTSERDNHLLKVYDAGNEFVWEPITYNPVFGCYCLLLEWYKDHLMFIYQEKHEVYICAVKDREVRHFKFHGEEIERKGNLIAYDTYMGKIPGKVRLIQIPELTELEPLDLPEAEKRGLIPTGLNRFDGFLALK